MKKKFTDIPYYRRFTNDRNRALEKLLNRTHKIISLKLAESFAQIEPFLFHAYSQIPKEDYFTNTAKQVLDKIDKYIVYTFHSIEIPIIQAILTLRRSSYLLAKAAEAQAISGAQDEATKVNLSNGKQHVKEYMHFKSGESIPDRVQLSLNRIRRDIMDAVEMSRVMQETPQEMLGRFMASLPKKKVYKKTPKVLKTVVKEAAGEGVDFRKKTLADLQFLDDAELEELLGSLQDEDLAALRAPTAVFDIDVGDPELEEHYGWELEQSITHDFVSEVRSGQIDAANEAGIDEFVWIAIIDSKTDDCCMWRDGLTTQEIQDKLEKDHSDDECDSDVPPAHFNCRCDIAPAKDGLPEKPVSNAPEFEEWLNDLG